MGGKYHFWPPKTSMKIKILPADRIFSQIVRKRDRKCVRCGSPVEFNEAGNPISHQCSHYWSRGNWNTRYDLKNCDVLCFACHRLWGGDDRREYEAFKRKQLGAKGYRDLEIRKNTYAKRDPKLALLYVKSLIEEKKITIRVLPKGVTEKSSGGPVLHAGPVVKIKLDDLFK